MCIELFQGIDTDRVHPFIEQLIAEQAPLLKASDKQIKHYNKQRLTLSWTEN
jgi:hypothetical protein